MFGAEKYTLNASYHPNGEVLLLQYGSLLDMNLKMSAERVLLIIAWRISQEINSLELFLESNPIQILAFVSVELLERIEAGS